MPQQIRMVKVRSFSYYMFSSQELAEGDLYIVKESEVPEYIRWFASVPEELQAALPEALATFEGEGGSAVTGIRLEKDGCRYLDCTTFSGEEDSILFYGRDAHHSTDGGALRAAKRILNIE